MRWKARGEVFTRDGLFFVVRDDGGIDEIIYHANNHFLMFQEYKKCESKEAALAWLDKSCSKNELTHTPEERERARKLLEEDEGLREAMRTP